MEKSQVIELAGIKYRVLNVLTFSSMLAVITLLLYLSYRVKYSLTALGEVSGLPAFVNSSLYFVSELGLLSGFYNYTDVAFQLG